MAIRASKGAVVGGAETERDVRSEVEEPRRSPAEREDVDVDWTWEAE